jgi:hypothetical protein
MLTKWLQELDRLFAHAAAIITLGTSNRTFPVCMLVVSCLLVFMFNRNKLQKFKGRLVSYLLFVSDLYQQSDILFITTN